MEKVIIAQISVQASKTEAFLKLAKTMVAQSNAEAGCLQYRLLNEVDKETEFLFHEKYVNAEAIEIHNASEHFLDFVKNITPLLAKDPIIEVF
ncbi:putative quinol monooxygenase [Algibacter lectus]|uniref:putative quinol monooxygenase n=1 Tax=Algibacter lectus TaxID=221126 RepID=UPI0008EA8B8B|nr:putative quinol monooxygenase [Algibacter lectus]MDO7138568.1 putative quinol monooxygenase [Algibacter lectus]SFD64622.1 Quinol monooxygenase YgiN [Algibacter lectus]